MYRIPLSWRVLAAGAGLALALPTAVAAPAPAAAPAPDKGDAVNPVEKFRKELDKPITIKLDRLSLTAAVEALHNKTNIAIAIDSQTIAQVGINADQPPAPVEIDVKDMKVRNVLRAILAPYGLSYAPLGDAVLVTTDDMAMYRQLRQRVSVDLDGVGFAAALKQIGRDTAVNLVLDSRVEKQADAKVSLRLEDVPLETVVRLLAEMANLKPVRVGNTLFVTSKENANEMRNDPDIAQPNAGARAQDVQQLQLFQAQLGVLQGGFQPGIAGPPGGGTIVAPPGVVPAVPPTVPPVSDAPKADNSPPDDKSKEQKDAPPADPKPLTK